MKQPLTESMKSKIMKALQSQEDISFAYLYGSSLRDATTARDLDIAVYLKNYKGLLESDLRRAEEIKEVIEPNTNMAVDVRVLNEAPVEFQLEVIETGLPIYISDEESFTDYLESLSRKAIETIQYRYSIEGKLCRL